jgi:hypothetical protein
MKSFKVIIAVGALNVIHGGFHIFQFLQSVILAYYSLNHKENETMEKIAKSMIKQPKEKYMQGLLWQWKEPEQGHRYIMGVDVSRGDSDDFSAINIVDFDAREQVLEYVGKMPPDDLASVAYKWGILYDAFIVIDITGGMGVATSRKLQELGYKNLYIDGGTTIQSFLDQDLIDEMIITKVPVTLKEGIPLFKNHDHEAKFALSRTEDLGSGILKSFYIKMRI